MIGAPEDDLDLVLVSFRLDIPPASTSFETFGDEAGLKHLTNSEKIDIFLSSLRQMEVSVLCFPEKSQRTI